MSTQAADRQSPEFLVREVERTYYDYRFAWEGEREEIRVYEDATLRVLPVPVYGWHALIENARIDARHAGARIAALEREASEGGRPVQWVFGDTPEPPDLAQRLEALGLQRSIHWDGLALTDLTVELPVDPAIRIEQVSAENAGEYVDVYAPSTPEMREARLAAVHRYLQFSRPEALAYLARLDGAAAGAVVLRIEPGGVAYLRNAITRPEFRSRGVYLAMIAHRLRLAREAGCQAMVVQAQTHTSSPILRKRGFQRVCGFYAYSRPEQPADAAGRS